LGGTKTWGIAVAEFLPMATDICCIRIPPRGYGLTLAT